jgi:hypothetical protein
MEPKPLTDLDVAISLLRADESLGEEICSALPADLKLFFYPAFQRELILERDGVNTFPAVFRGARLVVILFRAGWGDSRWTRLEKSAITDRFLDEGPSFLLLVRLDASEPPPWFPITNFWVDHLTLGTTGVTTAIVDRVRHGDIYAFLELHRALRRRQNPHWKDETSPLLIIRPLVAAVSWPISAGSDEAAIFELVAQVGRRMPR